MIAVFVDLEKDKSGGPLASRIDCDIPENHHVAIHAFGKFEVLASVEATKPIVEKNTCLGIIFNICNANRANFFSEFSHLPCELFSKAYIHTLDESKCVTIVRIVSEAKNLSTRRRFTTDENNNDSNWIEVLSEFGLILDTKTYYERLHSEKTSISGLEFDLVWVESSSDKEITKRELIARKTTADLPYLEHLTNQSTAIRQKADETADKLEKQILLDMANAFAEFHRMLTGDGSDNDMQKLGTLIKKIRASLGTYE